MGDHLLSSIFATTFVLISHGITLLHFSSSIQSGLFFAAGIVIFSPIVYIIHSAVSSRVFLIRLIFSLRWLKSMTSHLELNAGSL
jgi:hypothetical protein